MVLCFGKPTNVVLLYSGLQCYGKIKLNLKNVETGHHNTAMGIFTEMFLHFV